MPPRHPTATGNINEVWREAGRRRESETRIEPEVKLENCMPARDGTIEYEFDENILLNRSMHPLTSYQTCSTYVRNVSEIIDLSPKSMGLSGFRPCSEVVELFTECEGFQEYVHAPVPSEKRSRVGKVRSE